MPQKFKQCVKKGGRVRTINPKKGKYMHVCFDEQGSHAGKVKKKKRKVKK